YPDIANLHGLIPLKAAKCASRKLIGATIIFLINLGLGDGSALPVGVPLPWPTATPPAGWLKCNGAAFSA
ncbi:phage tail protein, partial [Pantoea endophytica]|uniref:phage tail protein n=1 Tax=Pantoea endophytica TaxID=92488 RepID=UPI003016CF03